MLVAGNANIEQTLRSKSTISGNNLIISYSEFTDDEKAIIGEDTLSDIQDYAIYFDLDQNGMGYNNLIYMGIVLGDLQERKKVESCSFNTLLIEEPEAHLHPQLQDLVFDFFKRVSSNRNASTSLVQVFVTSHSPILASRANIDNINVIYHDEARQIRVTALKNCPLEENHKEDLRRYLDVTKSQLFFSKGVILVEGISEALLLPIFAQRMSRRLDQNAIEVVNISGTAFEPFALLFNYLNNGDKYQKEKRLNIRAAIITDDDRCTSKEDPNRINEDMDAEEILEKLANGFISPRAERATSLEGGNLIVKKAYKTFEFELARAEDNLKVLLPALHSVHPRIADNLTNLFEEINNSELKAVYFWLACKDTKAEFAQRLAALLQELDEDGKPTHEFIIPKYIEDVIKHVALVETDK